MIINLRFYFLFQSGPVRLFTPYKRRRRARDISDGETPPRKIIKSDNSRDCSNNEESDNEVGVSEKEIWPQYVSAEGLVVHQTQDQEQVMQAVNVDHEQTDELFKKLDEMSNTMIKLAYDFRRTVEEAKELSRQQRREQALVAQLNSTRGDVIEAVGLQPASNSHNKKVFNLIYFFLINQKIKYCDKI